MERTSTTLEQYRIRDRVVSPTSIIMGLVLLSLLGMICVLISTSRGGLGTSPDSIHYIAASKSLLAGAGFMRFTGERFTLWPPLYPTFLAGIAAVSQGLGSDVSEGIRYVQSIEFGIIIFLSGKLFLRHIQSRVLAFVAVGFIVFSFPLLTITVRVLSELLYVLLSLLFVLYFPVFIKEQKVFQVVTLAVLAALGTLDRYAAIGIIPAGIACIVFLMQRAPVRKRIIYVLVFSLSVIPYILWLMYTASLQTAPKLQRETTPVDAVVRNIQITADLLADWFVPPTLRAVILPGVIYVGLVLIAVWVIYRFHRRKDDTQAGEAVIALYAGVYMLFFYIAHGLVHSTDIDIRHLGVLYIPIIFLIFFAVDQGVRALSNKRWGYMLVVAMALLGLVYPVVKSTNEIRQLSLYCCGAYKFRQLGLIQWLNTHSVEGSFFSNTPLPLFYTRYSVYSAPHDIDGWTAIPLAPDRDTYFIWFNDPTRYSGLGRYYYDVPYTAADLAAIAQVELVAEFADGSIYRLRSLKPA